MWLMGGVVEIDPSQVTAVAATFSAAAAGLSAAVQRLQSGLADLGAYYGSDKPGREFGEPYEQTHYAIVNALTQVAEGVCSADGGLCAAASNHEANDQESAAFIARVGASG